MGNEMDAAAAYRRYAAECLKLFLGSPGEKAVLLEMASKWLLLAEHAEQRDSDNSTRPCEGRG
jgi:hypothetical protein